MLDAAGSALSPRQRRRLEHAAATFIARHPALTDLPVRFDMMLVTPGRWPRHLVDAWREGSL
jgi:putative endonuclease